MERQDFHFKVKSVSDEGFFSGFASTYNNQDLQGDTIVPGAFTKSISDQGDGLPCLWAHDSEKPLGLVKLQDSQTGLIANGQLLLGDPNADIAFRHLKAKTVRGLSIGFNSVPAKTTYNDDGSRILREIKLFEVSIVAIPANPLALVSSVKSLDQAQRFLKTMEGKSLSADALVHVRAIHESTLALLGLDDDMDDDDDDDDGQCAAILGELKGMLVMANKLAEIG